LRWLIGLVTLAAVSAAVSGCGNSGTSATAGTGGDAPKEIRETDDGMAKALEKYNKSRRR
jgi:hypothetical protein